MPRFYCDYCDSFLTHDSYKGRKQHNYGWKHRENYRMHYQQVIDAQTKKLVESGALAPALARMAKQGAPPMGGPGGPGGPRGPMMQQPPQGALMGRGPMPMGGPPRGNMGPPPMSGRGPMPPMGGPGGPPRGNMGPPPMGGRPQQHQGFHPRGPPMRR
eukprot:TRINITY_DN240_c0_g1_i1.p1 TRINITY_DN240_c0_g1~~TRINITY_DN240_c0_g1_i1.p1  ORF type:complete len:158 (-),score=45.93 TRINITY_DN240_c0_g1_i1:208-681(-)